MSIAALHEGVHVECTEPCRERSLLSRGQLLVPKTEQTELEPSAMNFRSDLGRKGLTQIHTCDFRSKRAQLQGDINVSIVVYDLSPREPYAGACRPPRSGYQDRE